MSLRATVSQGLYQLGIEDDVARAIARYEQWEGYDLPLTQQRDAGWIGKWRRRLWQALGDYSNRKTALEWGPIFVRFFTLHDREDLADVLIGAFADAKYEGRRLREEGRVLEGFERRPPMAKVPSSRRRDRGAA